MCTGVGNASHYTHLICFGFPTVYIDGNGNWNGRDRECDSREIRNGNEVLSWEWDGEWEFHGNERDLKQ